MSASSSHSDEFDMVDHAEANLEPDDLAKLQAWLQPTDYMADSSEFHRHLSSQAPGTGTWLCVPGAGKSVIAASMIQHLQSEGDVPILFFFFRYIVVANRKSRSLICDWLCQLLPYSTQLQASLLPLAKRQLSDLSDQGLWDQLLLSLSSVEKAYCIVDALDEMELNSDDTFLGRLNSLAIFRPSSIKLLTTSRAKQYLQSSLRDTSIVHINLEDDLVGNDISLYVSHRLQNVIPGAEDAGNRASLASTICERAQGLFLFARLLLDQIIPVLRNDNQVDIRSLLKSLPTGLEETYNSLLFSAAKSLNIDIAIQIFMLEFATHSPGNIRLNELASALNFCFPPSMLPQTAKSIARLACSPLLEIMEDETIQVFHHSFTEFLLDSKRIAPQKSENYRQFPVLESVQVHRDLSLRCLQYLKSGVLDADKPPQEISLFSDDETIIDYDYMEAKLHYPFLMYAVENWSYHASKYDMDDEVFFVAIRDFQNNNAHFQIWLSYGIRFRYNQVESFLSNLHLAAFLGLTKFLLHLLRCGERVDCCDADKKTAFYHAVANRQLESASVLLQHGANPKVEDNKGVKPIHLAARKNDFKMVKLLLEAGVDPLSPGPDYTCSDVDFHYSGQKKASYWETAVNYVSYQGHIDTILIMLPFLEPIAVEQLLCFTCHRGNIEAARAVLDNSNVSADAKLHGATALYHAMFYQKDQGAACIELLLNRGADPNMTSAYDPKGRYRKTLLQTPLHTLATQWNEEKHTEYDKVFKILIAAGASLENKDEEGCTPFHCLFSSKGCFLKSFQSMLEAGADVLTTFQYGYSALHKSLQGCRDLELVETLLQHGADVNACDGSGDTPLHTLLKSSFLVKNPKNSRSEILALLLRWGALSNIKNNAGFTAPEVALSGHECNLEDFRTVLLSCSDETVPSRCLWKVEQMTGEERLPFLQIFIAMGLSLDTCDNEGKFLLLEKIHSGDIWKVLVECGANLHVVDSRGRGALHKYAMKCTWTDKP